MLVSRRIAPVQPPRFQAVPMNIRPFEGVSPAIDASAYVDPSAIIIGDVTVGADSSIWPLTVIRGDINRIRIGVRANIQDGCVLHVTHKSRFADQGWALTVGEGVTVGHKAVLHGCTIQDYCLVGMGAVVMDGAVAQTGCMIAAGAMVTPGKVCETGFLYMGAPARKHRALTDGEMQYLRYSADHYVKLAHRYRG